jgi:flagellar protein FlaG
LIVDLAQVLREAADQQACMDLRIGHLNLPAPVTGPRRTRHRRGAVRVTASAGEAAAAIPATPPPDLLREVEAAGRRAEQLWHARRELHFDVDEESGRVVVQVRDLEGRVVRTIPPSEALAIMSGRAI